MKRAALGLLLCLLAPAALARELLACGHPSYPPVSWHSQGQLVGLAPQVARELFAELGHEVRLLVLGNWKRCLLEVKRGRVDIVVAAYRTREREAWMGFSQSPLVADPILLFTRRDRPVRFDDWDDLRGLTVGLLLGDSFGERFDQFAARHLNIEWVSSGEQNFIKLAQGRIDFMPVGLYSWTLQNRRFGYDQLIVQQPGELVTEHYYLGVRREPSLLALLPHLDQRLRELAEDGTLRRLDEHYSARYLAEPHRMPSLYDPAP
ncbi:substrate-binding periplasmic protein [Pseudomonas benzenivorans]|uniref:Amino acid ABC transporter substrate-binding protein n=1 Tax=Pseudomonas benzenivorans TaxID=556533 RepID=A0ABY5HCV2_9PSED|nr:transporter substrate-binding domain-containing protein [Pseudomonas benzenivorans]UTW08811.1 amino acid ABC transporter substrate-binding protein [Pseudomonas benzenivorans]